METYSYITTFIQNTRQAIINMGGFKQYDNYGTIINFIYQKIDVENKQEEVWQNKLREQEYDYSKFIKQLNSRMELLNMFDKI